MKLKNHVQVREFLSVAEAAEEIGSSRRFLDGRIAAGEIPVFKPSARLIRIKRADLDRWFAAYTHGGQALAAAVDLTPAEQTGGPS